MHLSRAVEVYSKLTIGDGLASQIPSVLISLAAGLLISRCSERMNFSRELLVQTVANVGTAWAVAIVLVVLGFCGMPLVPMSSLAVGVVLISRALRQQLTGESKAGTPPRVTAPATTSAEHLVAYDPLELELGLRLLPLAKEGTEPSLLAGLTQLRQRFALEFGLVVPRIRVRDNLRLAPNEFCLKILGNQVCHGRLDPEGLLAVATSAVAAPLRGQSARGLVSDMPQWWIDESSRRRAVADGYSILTPPEALLESLLRAIRRHADEILTRDAVKALLQAAHKVVPAVVDEVSAGAVSLGTIQKVLQQLVRERVPLKQLPRILEAICDCAHVASDPLELTNRIRERIAGSISAAFRDRDGRLRCARLSSDLEHTLHEAVETGMHLRPSAELQNLIRNICRELDRQTAILKSTGFPQILLVPQSLRHHVAQWSASVVPDLIVLGDREITADTHLVQVATIGAIAVAA
jgi:flagellar biosynthesis protein FlhA